MPGLALYYQSLYLLSLILIHQKIVVFRQKSMNIKFQKSQILILSVILILLIIAPLLSSSIRPTYLYFIFNLLIIALGAEAGLLSTFSNPPSDDHKKHSVSFSEPSTDKKTLCLTNVNDKSISANTDCPDKKCKAVEKSLSEKIVRNVKIEKVKKCPSTPSIFFIGGGEAEAEAEEVMEEYEEVEEEVGGLNRQELYTKAETFIGNFYKQLKMQREDSWKRIHGFYHKAF